MNLYAATSPTCTSKNSEQEVIYLRIFTGGKGHMPNGTCWVALGKHYGTVVNYIIILEHGPRSQPLVCSVAHEVVVRKTRGRRVIVGCFDWIKVVPHILDPSSIGPRLISFAVLFPEPFWTSKEFDTEMCRGACTVDEKLSLEARVWQSSVEHTRPTLSVLISYYYCRMQTLT